MEQREIILRRVASTCIDFAGQLSYHRSLTKCRGKFRLTFWTSIFNNTIDFAVLDWLHLFGSHSDDLHWKRIVGNTKTFRDGLLEHLGLDENEWEAYRQTVKEYRDKDVAHIEVRPVGNVPRMNTALEAADYSHEQSDLIDYHAKSLKQTEKIVSLAYVATREIEERVL